MADINRVGVVGCGLMGSGIAQVVATAGIDTLVLEMNEELLQKGLGRLEKNLDRAVQKEKLTAADRDGILGRLTGVDTVEALKDCDLVIEAI